MLKGESVSTCTLEGFIRISTDSKVIYGGNEGIIYLQNHPYVMGHFQMLE